MFIIAPRSFHYDPKDKRKLLKINIEGTANV